MTGLLLKGGSKEDLKMLAALAEKIGLKSKFLSEEDIEDIGLARAMQKGRTKTYIDTTAFLKKLEE